VKKLAVRSESAEADLREIAFQVAVMDGRVETAERLIDELIEQAENLARTSGVAEMGTIAPELGERIRLFSYKRWVVIFRYEKHGVEVLRIVDGSQDYLSWKFSWLDSSSEQDSSQDKSEE
jgi:plasmid stabilization system protein ParE